MTVNTSYTLKNVCDSGTTCSSGYYQLEIKTAGMEFVLSSYSKNNFNDPSAVDDHFVCSNWLPAGCTAFDESSTSNVSHKRKTAVCTSCKGGANPGNLFYELKRWTNNGMIKDVGTSSNKIVHNRCFARNCKIYGRYYEGNAKSENVGNCVECEAGFRRVKVSKHEYICVNETTHPNCEEYETS